MDLQFLLDILISVAVGVSMHSLVEPINIKKQVAHLDASLRGQKYSGHIPMPFAIDSPTKAIFVGAAFIAICGGLSYIFVSKVDITNSTAVVIVGAILLLKELINTKQIDSYHRQIAKVIANVETSS